MKRRQFLKNSLLGGIAISLAPQQLFAQPQKTTLLPLPQAAQHIRHGLLQNLANTQLHKTCDWISHFQTNIFLGASQQNSDLLHYSFRLDNQQYGIGLKDKQVYISTSGKILDYNLNSEKPINIELTEEKRLHFFNPHEQTQNLEIKSSDSHFICLMRGKATNKNHLLHPQQGLLIDGDVNLKIYPHSVIFMLTKQA